MRFHGEQYPLVPNTSVANREESMIIKLPGRRARNLPSRPQRWSITNPATGENDEASFAEKLLSYVVLAVSPLSKN